MQIYIAKAGKQIGPFSTDQIQTMLTAGMINISDSAWHDGLPSWVPLHQILKVPPPIPLSPPTSTQPLPSSIISTAPSIFLYIPKNRLVFMTILSLGIYQAYWVYRNWRYLKERDGLSIKPFWRGFFSIFFIHSLFTKIKNDSLATGIRPATFSTSLAVWWIVLVIFGNLLGKSPEILMSLLGLAVALGSVFLIMPVQEYINSVNESLQERPSFYRWSSGHTVCAVIGGILWLFILVGLVTGTQS